ncbi:MAG: hypothetical protein QM742_09410 [Aquabacterium sp.]
MRVLNESEVQAVSGGITFAELGGRLIGDSAPTAVKSAVGLVASPFVLMLGVILMGYLG